MNSKADVPVVKDKGTSTENLLEPELAKSLAVDHVFERASVARVLHAGGMLLRRGLGRVTVDQARAFAQHEPRFIRPDFAGKLLTTREVLDEEDPFNHHKRIEAEQIAP